MSKSLRPSHAARALVAAFGAIAVVRVVRVWDELPPRMASHFGPSGQPDAFMPRAGFFILYASIFGLAILSMLLPNAVRRIPSHLINLPYRRYWAAPERFPRALAMLSEWMAWFSVGLAALALATLELVIRANRARAPLDNGAMLILIGAFLFYTLLWLLALWRSFRPPSR
jgi:uncharacterized membrane protein